MEEYLAELNDSQREAVLYCNSPELVIAGAGSGKTRVLTYKIAWLLKQGWAPHTILALTFTNKAAREMKERVASIVGENMARRLWIGTFHSISSRILRKEAERLGFSSNFTIYDATDSKNLIKKIIKEMQLDDKVYRPGMVQSRISNAKNALITWRAYEQNKELVESDILHKIPLLGEIYKQYQNRCLQAGAMDFDDLLLQTNILFRDFPEVLESYRNFFRYVLVDEYQDTNFAQHSIVRRLCAGHGHICVVGDDAQSIYSFRGANVDNILQFRNVYPGCKIFKLEQNYRSTQNIVNAANSLIEKNREQIPKNVYSKKEEGDKIKVLSSLSDYEEAYIVAGRIEEMKRKEYGRKYADFAILYRTNAQSRILEEAMRKRGIPYRIYGGLSFYQHKEVKDVISYFRLVINPHDEEAFKRVINYPARGIGDTTVNKLVKAAATYNVSLWKVLQAPSEYAVSINAGTEKKLVAFREWLMPFIKQADEKPADELAADLIKQSGLMATLLADCSNESISKVENLQELLKGINEFCEIRREEGSGQATLNDFLAEVALLTDQDNNKDEFTDKVTMMTIHAAKGLEFPNVFIVGLEEDLFPSAMSKGNPRAIEEERRLFYVAITRAEQNCIVSYARNRYKNGQQTICTPSRFLQDIDRCYLDVPLVTSSRLENISFDEERHRYQRPAFASPLQQPKAESYHMEKVQPVSKPRRLTKIEPNQEAQSQAVSVVNSVDLHIGATVLHERFGQGEILSFEGEGNNQKAIVAFDNFGQKKLLLKFARLKVMD